MSADIFSSLYDTASSGSITVEQFLISVACALAIGLILAAF